MVEGATQATRMEGQLKSTQVNSSQLMHSTGMGVVWGDMGVAWACVRWRGGRPMVGAPRRGPMEGSHIGGSHGGVWRGGMDEPSPSLSLPLPLHSLPTLPSPPLPSPHSRLPPSPFPRGGLRGIPPPLPSPPLPSPCCARGRRVIMSVRMPDSSPATSAIVSGTSASLSGGTSSTCSEAVRARRESENHACVCVSSQLKSTQANSSPTLLARLGFCAFAAALFDGLGVPWRGRVARASVHPLPA